VRDCDPWWENETDWHRDWKDQFPVDWQEVVLQAPSGERHIADVQTEQGWVIEFQHSYLHAEGRRAREAFYTKLIWVVDGVRCKRDEKQFMQSLVSGACISTKPPLFSIYASECALLQKWGDSRVPVFFDFGAKKPEESVLWCLLPGTNVRRYVVPFTRAGFPGIHRTGATRDLLAESLTVLSEAISSYALRCQAQELHQLAQVPQYGRRQRRPASFHEYLALKRRARSRF
jgi:hypothetical protein